MGTPAAIARDRRILRSPAALWRAGAFGVVVLAGEGDPVTLTGTGRALWEALATPIGVDELAATLAAAHGAPLEQVRPDVEAAVARLEALGAVEAAR